MQQPQRSSGRRASPVRMLRSTTTASRPSPASEAAAGADSLPVELWIEVLSRMSVQQACAASTACRQLSSVRDAGAQVAGSREFGADWPRVEALEALDWKAKIEAVSNYREELASVPSASVQSVVTDSHRAIATEWLAEVSSYACVAAV